MQSRLFRKSNLLQFGLSEHQEMISLLIASGLFQTLFYLSLFFLRATHLKVALTFSGLSVASLSLPCSCSLVKSSCYSYGGRLLGSWGQQEPSRLWLVLGLGWFPLVSTIAKQTFFTALS